LSLFARLQHAALDEARDHGLRLADFGMGLSCAYAVVEGAQGHALGAALTPRDEGPASVLRGETLREMVEAGSRYDPFARAAALAVMNAVSRYLLPPEPEAGDLRATVCAKVLAATKPGSRIVVIGYLRPLVECLKREGRDVAVFCRGHRDPQQGIYNDIFEYEAAGEAEVLLMTGAVLTGATLEALLALSPRASMRVLTGFSSGVHPRWLEGSGVTHLASIRLEEAVKMRLLRNEWEALFDYPAYWLEVH
jgi:uncharacterized protein